MTTGVGRESLRWGIGGVGSWDGDLFPEGELGRLGRTDMILESDLQTQHSTINDLTLTLWNNEEPYMNLTCLFFINNCFISVEIISEIVSIALE